MGLLKFGKKNKDDQKINYIKAIKIAVGAGFTLLAGLVAYKRITNNANKDNYNDIPDYSGYCPDCPICGSTMKYSYLKSEFMCPSCGHNMDEAEWDFEIDCDDPDNPPYGCQACGGPWPHCKTSCKLFDD